MEETAKAVLEYESQEAAERLAAAVASPALAVPASLQELLMARFDRLGKVGSSVRMIADRVGLGGDVGGFWKASEASGTRLNSSTHN